MIALAVAFNQCRFKVSAHLGKDLAQVFDDHAREHAAAVLRDEDQMDMQCKDTMSTSS